MRHFLVVDLANSFHRARHVANRGSDLEERVAFSVHCTLQSIAAAWRDQKATHVVICLEGRSWRKDFYKPYKATRVVARMARTEAEEKEDNAFYEAQDDLINFFENKTNVIVLHHPNLEADDLIGGWVQLHPNDQHTIISSDSDYHQLLAENVNQYNGVTGELHTITGIYDKRGKLMKDKKTGEPKAVPNPQWILFEKCMRGDSTDNVFSAYPNVRTKSTKNKVGLEEAFNDRQSKGYAWNNLMLQRWTDPDGVEHKVLDDYRRNVTLIDLSAQPDHIRAFITETINNVTPKQKPMVGAQFLKLCGKYNMEKLSEQAATFGTILSSGYSNGISV